MLMWKSAYFVTYLFYFLCVISRISGQKSQAKCKEYAKYVYVEEDSLVRSSKDKVSQCGIVEVPLVIGGTEAAPKEFPHLALIGFGTGAKIEWKCGGTLISETFVLSAAHCNKYHGDDASKVRLGEVNLESDSESEIQEFNIAKIISHPEYKSQKYNDIILFKLDHAATFNAYVRPACLHTGKSIKEPKGIAAGFGKTSFDASEGSKKLMKVNLNIVPNNDCEKYFKREKQTGQLKDGVIDSMLCAGELKGGKDTCQGDSGGPLQVVLADPYCMYSIVGIVSFGKFCGFANQPAIYTKVSSYIPWIEKNVWP